MNRSRITGDLVSQNNIFVDIANDRVGIGSTIPGQKLSLPDNAKIALGNSADLQLSHDGSNAVLQNNTGTTFIIDDQVDFQSSPGAARNLSVAGLNVRLPRDNAILSLGASDDLKLIHNGTDTFIDNNTGDFYLQTTSSGDDIILQSKDDVEIQVNGGASAIYAEGGGQIYIKHNANNRLITKDYGVEVVGTTDTDGLIVSGISTFSNRATITHDLTISGTAPRVIFTDTDNNPDYRINVDGGSFSIQDTTNGNANRFVINNVGNVTVPGNFDVVGNIAGFGDLTLTDTATDSAAGPEFKLFRNSASPADADYLGQIKFAGESDTGVERNYAKITGKILDASNGTEDGIIEFAHIKAGSQVITGRFRSDSLQLLNGTQLTVAGTTTLNSPVTINTSTSKQLILSGASSPYISFEESSTAKAYIQWNAAGYLELRNSEDDSTLYIKDGLCFSQSVGGTQHTIWHSGNDGAGSGLDADSLDGIGSGGFLRSNVADTASGQITLTTSQQYPLVINSSDNGKIVLQGSSNPYIRFREGTTDKAYIQFHSNGTLYIVNQESGEQLFISSGSTGLQFHHDNTNSTVWHAGNDGSGSGLDADTLDGVQGSSFLRSDAADTFTNALTFSQDNTDVVDFSANSSNLNRGISFNNRTALSAGGTSNAWLRLNNNSEFTNGVYTPGLFRVDGSLVTCGQKIVLSVDNTFTGQSVGNTATYDEGIFWHTDNGYGIYRTSGAWSSPNYQQLKIKWVTGMILDGGTSFGKSGVEVQGNMQHVFRVNTTNNGKIALQGSDNPYIRWQEGTTNKAYIQWNASGFFGLYNQEDGSSLRIKDAIDFSTDGSTYHTVWHAGNDGSGSGLDADTLDGAQGSQFLRSDSADTCSGQITFTNSIISRKNGNKSTQGGAALVLSHGTTTNLRMNFFIHDDFPSGSGTGYLQVTESGVSNARDFNLQGYGGNVMIGNANATPTEKLEVNGNVKAANFIGSGSALTNIPASALPKQESGISIVGNFGQWQTHATYNNFNTEPNYWGWNYVMGNTNAPNTASGQWYRCRLSLGSEYGKGSDNNDYSMEIAIPRTQSGTQGQMWLRPIENGSEQTWIEVGSRPYNSVIPRADNAIDLGSSSIRWANLYTADAHFNNIGTGGNEIDGTEGSWTLQEAEDNIYMINRKNGKRYKIKMEEV